MPIVGVNHGLPIFHNSKILVHYYTTDETIHHSEIGYKINPTLRFNNVLKIIVKKCWIFHFLLGQ